MIDFQDPDSDRFTFSLQHQLVTLQIFAVQICSNIRSFTDENLSRTCLGCKPCCNVDVISQRGEIGCTTFASYHADKSRPRMDANSHRKPRPLRIAMPRQC